MSSTRPSLNSSGHRHSCHCYRCRPHSFPGPRTAGRCWLRRCRAHCRYVPSRLTIEATPKPLELIGSIAAGLQASIGNVVAGSLFAALQSIAMGGGVPAAITAVGGLGAGAAGAAVAAVAI
jgi:hypothetical protein